MMALAAVLIFAQCCICILPVWGYTAYQRAQLGDSLPDSGLLVCAWAGSRGVNVDLSSRMTVEQAVPFQIEFGPAGVGFFGACESRASGQ